MDPVQSFIAYRDLFEALVTVHDAASGDLLAKYTTKSVL